MIPIAWTTATERIHEVPNDFQPTLASSVGLYTEESRPILEVLMQRALATGEGWECDLQGVLESGLPAFVMGDVTRLHRIPTNLLSNAVKFTERGGQVTVSLSSTGVVDEAARFGISVKDTGIGIRTKR